jgi:iron complex transport system ATP-binding protein
MLTLEEVCFGYGKHRVIQNISLEVPRQAFMALIGPNGGGKTTLLRLMSKVLRPQQGRVLLQGKPLAEIGARDLARQMAVITSEQFFEFPYPVSDVVAMGRSPHLQRLQRMSQRDWEVVDQALKLTQVDHLGLRPASQLSSGERQRVLIARAIAQQPSVLMLDEPNAHLDINHQIAIFNLLRSLNRDHKMTLIVVLHDLTWAAAFCQTVALLHQGKLVKIGRPEEVITAELIRQTYGAEVAVYPSPLGGFPQVVYVPAG